MSEKQAVAKVAGVPPNAAKIVAHLLTAVRECRDGELVLSNGGDVARIYLFRGKIAWIHTSSHKAFLGQVLLQEANIPQEMYSAAVKDCRKTGKNIGETLVAWELIDEETLSNCLRMHVGQHLNALLNLSGNVSALFVPQERPYSLGLVFDIQELFVHIGHSSLLSYGERGSEADDEEEASGSSRFAYALSQIPKVLAVGSVSIGGPGPQLLGHKASSEEAAEIWQHTALAAKDLFEHLNTQRLRALRDRFVKGYVDQGYFDEVVQFSKQYVHFFGRIVAEPSKIFVAISDRRANLGMVLAKCRAVCAMEPVGGTGE